MGMEGSLWIKYSKSSYKELTGARQLWLVRSELDKHFGLVLEDMDVRGKDYVGGLVGENQGGTIQKIYITGRVTGTGDKIGGLVGLA